MLRDGLLANQAVYWLLMMAWTAKPFFSLLSCLKTKLKEALNTSSHVYLQLI